MYHLLCSDGSGVLRKCVFGVLTDVEWDGFSVHMRIINELVSI